MAVENVTVEIGDMPIEFETGKLAKQANGSVVVRSGDTVVLVTAVGAQESRPGADFFPLTVDVEERMYAAGKIPGGFIKRESRPSDRATLTARMTDRPIRPLWPKGYRNETQVVATVLSVDQVNAFDILCINGASAALMLSEMPFQGPVGAVRIGLVGDEFIINPTLPEIEDSELDLIVAGSDEAISMVEAGAKEVDEETMLEALQIAHEEIRRLCAAQVELREAAGKPKWEVEGAGVDEKLLAKIEKGAGKDLAEATREQAKLARRDKVAAVRAAAAEKILGDEPDPEEAAAFNTAFEALQKRLIRHRIAVDKERPDGRRADEIRPISCEVRVLPRVHGSGLFTRGETQVLTSLALGTTKEAQRIDGLGIETTKRYIHHYNFPPFSVGETGFMRGPKRRDIGHGALAERALLPMIPEESEFPYTLRLVSETLESNGSSSMASVCGSTLALLDAGVRITRPVAGIAMGLIKEGDEHIVLSDIQGDEDHLGDMDFKVAGTSEGITALQMDIKITGVTFEILRDALAQAKDGRQFILGVMNETIPGPRDELSPWAPRITAIKIDPERIGTVIGKGGETIRGLEADYGVEISVEDDGTVKVYGVEGQKADEAVEMIRAMTKDVEVGDTYLGAKVVKTTTFGAFVELTKGVDGLLHISNLSRGRVNKVEDVLNRGDTVDVRVVEVDKLRGRIGLRIIGLEDDEPEGAGNGGVAAADGEPAPAPQAAEAHDRRVIDGATSRRPVVSTGRGGLRSRLGARPRRALGGDRRLDRRRLALRARRGGGHLPLPRAHALQGHADPVARGDRPGVRRPRRRGQRRHRQGLHGPVLPRPRRAGGPGDAGADRHAPAADPLRPRPGARGRPGGDRDVRGRPPGPDPRPGERRGLPRPGARPAGHRDRPGDRLRARRRRARVPQGATTRRPTSSSRRPATSPTSASPSSPSELLGDLPLEPGAGVYEAAQPGPPTLVVKEKATEQYHLCLGGPGLSRNDPRRHAQSVLDAVLGGSMSSRLFQEIREKRGLAYSVGSYAVGYADTGQVGVYLGTREDNLGHRLRDRRRASCGASGTSRCPTTSCAARRTTSRGAWSWAWRARARA